MERLEKLAVGTALLKAIKEETEDVKAEVKAEMYEAWERDKTSQKTLMLNGMEVGKVSVKKTSAKTETRLNTEAMVIEMEDAIEFAKANPEQFAEFAVRTLGVMPEGVFEETRTIPGGEFQTIAVTGCKPEVVAQALGEKLTEAVAGYLEA